MRDLIAKQARETVRVYDRDKERLERLACSWGQSPQEMLRDLIDFYEADIRKDLDNWSGRQPAPDEKPPPIFEWKIPRLR